MSDQPLGPDESSSPIPPSPAERIRTREQATIYIQGIVRDVLLDHIQAWRLMVHSETTGEEERAELRLVLGQAEVLARALRMANVMLHQAQSQVVPVDAPLIAVPGSRLPTGGL